MPTSSKTRYQIVSTRTTLHFILWTGWHLCYKYLLHKFSLRKSWVEAFKCFLTFRWWFLIFCERVCIENKFLEWYRVPETKNHDIEALFNQKPQISEGEIRSWSLQNFFHISMIVSNLLRAGLHRKHIFGVISCIWS